MIMKPYLFRHNDKVICAEPKRRSEGGGGRNRSSAGWFLQRQGCCSQGSSAPLVCGGSARESSAPGCGGPELCRAGNGKGKKSGAHPAVRWGVRQARLAGRLSYLLSLVSH